MVHRKTLMLLILTIGAYAQSPSIIRGIKVISPSTYDAQTHTTRLTFINDSPANITAWGYCVKAQNAPGNTISHSFCTWVDPLAAVTDRKIEVAKRPFLPEPDCPICRFIHPGEEKTLSSGFTAWPEVIDAKIEINLIVYADGTAETLNNEEGQHALQQVAHGRQASLEVRQKLLRIAQQILADPSQQHPTVAMINQLEQDPSLAAILREFKRPDWHRGSDREFIPDNEREYLQQYAADQQVWVSEFSKNQVKVGGR